MNELLVAIAEKERQLAALDAEALILRKPFRWRSLWPFAVGVTLWAAAVSLDARVASWQKQMTPAHLRHSLMDGQPIPWRHFVDNEDDMVPCDLWVSARGLAQIHCGGWTARGFGITDGEGQFHPWAPGCEGCDEIDQSLLHEVAKLAPWTALPLDFAANEARIARTLRAVEMQRCFTSPLIGPWRATLLVYPDGSSPQIVKDEWWGPHYLRVARCVERALQRHGVPRLTGEELLSIGLTIDEPDGRVTISRTRYGAPYHFPGSDFD